MTRRRLAEATLFAKPLGTSTVNGELADSQKARGAVKRGLGKPLLKSTTFAAALGLLVSVFASSLDTLKDFLSEVWRGENIDLLTIDNFWPFVVNLVAIFSTGWIALERKKKSEEDGV